MSYASKRRILEQRADVARADARAEARVALGSSATAYAGLTPTTINGTPVLASRGIGWGMRSRESRGTTIRAGKKGGLRLQRPNLAADAPKHGGAHLAAGDFFVAPDGSPATAPVFDARGNVIGSEQIAPVAGVAFSARVEHDVAYATPSLRAALGSHAAVTVAKCGDCGLGAQARGVERLPAPGRIVSVTRGDEDAPLRDTDPGDDDRTVAADAYWTRLRRERGEFRPDDFDDHGNLTETA